MKSLGYLVYGLLYLGKSNFCELDPAIQGSIGRWHSDNNEDL